MNLERLNKIKELKEQGYNSIQICNLLNIKLGTLGYYVKKLNLNNSRLNIEEKELITSLYYKRKTIKVGGD